MKPFTQDLSILFLFVITLQASCENKEFDPEQEYLIQPLHQADFCVGVNENPGLHQWEFSLSEYQVWKLLKHDDGSVSLINEGHDKALETPSRQRPGSSQTFSNSPDQDGLAALLYLAPYTGADEQRWYLKDWGEGWVSIENKLSAMAVDVMEGTHFNGAYILQWPYGDNANQRWKLESTYGEDRYFIRTGHTDKYLTAYARGSENGANIACWEELNRPFQHWHLLPVGVGRYKILNVASGKAMQVSLGQTTQSGNIEQWFDNGMVHQQWMVSADPLGGFRIESCYNGASLDVLVLGKTNGTNLMHYAYNGGPNQRFDILPVNGDGEIEK